MTIPDNVTSIGDCEFQGCRELSVVNLGSGLTSIGYAAFYGCSALTSIEIPDSVMAMGYGAFYECTALASLKIGNGTEGIGALTFYECRSLSSVVIADSVASIGYGAFYNCTSLTSVVIGSGVTNIGKSAFGNCSALILMTFRSNAPSLASDWIKDHSSGLVVRYYTGASGFTSPLWQGLSAEVVGSTLAAPQKIKAVPGPGSVTISWSALSGNGSEDIDYYIIFQDGVDIMHEASGTTVNISGLENGRTYIFQVAAHDLAGPGLNSSPVAAGTYYDLDPMVVTISSPLANSILNTENTELSWTIGRGSSVIAYFNISIDGGSQVRLSATTMSYLIGGLQDGAHTANVTVVDDQGNSAFQNISFTIDTQAPTIEVQVPTGREISTRTTIEVTFSEAMDHAATSIVLAGVTGSTTWSGPRAYFRSGGDPYWQHYIYGRSCGADLGGNAVATTWTFTTANVGSIFRHHYR